MTTNEEQPPKEELTAYLVGILRKRHSQREAEEHLEELEQLVDTMGVKVAGKELATLNNPTAAYLIGTGKLDMILASAELVDAGMIILDDDLTPTQQRNWEKLAKKSVIDRREVILDIFAQRAQTREARLQVELARMAYELPRLKRAWTHLERQRGGRGIMGGAGEAQIEVDRRLVRERITKAKKELANVRSQRATQRKGRQSRPVPTAALVGYTNSGKSSLLNAMTGAGVLAEDKLFATLDPTTRRIELENNQPLLLTDTVGFIRKLPHTLVAAFKATLEEAQVADFLIHVVDASHPTAPSQVRATNVVLKELEAFDKPIIYVFNKMDREPDPLILAELREMASPFVLTSAVTGEGLADLAGKLAEFAAEGLQEMILCLPPSRHDLISILHREAEIVSTRYEGADTVLEVSVPIKLVSRFEEYIHEVKDEEEEDS